MTITLNLSPAMEQKLQAQAAASGKDVETLVRDAVQVQLAIGGRSLGEILEPLHREVEASGISDEELTALVDQEIAAARAEQRAT